MTTTLRKAITALILLVFLPVGDALKGNGLRRQKEVVAATNFAANGPRSLVHLFAERQSTDIQSISGESKGTEDVEQDDIPMKASKTGKVTEDLKQDENYENPDTTESEDSSVDDTTTARKKGSVKGEKSFIDTTKGRGGGGKTKKGGKGSDASVTEPTIVPSFEDGIILPGPDDYVQLPEQVAGGVVQTTTRELPMYAIRYIVNSDRAPNAGDYNELAIVTTEFLDEKFAIAFQATPANHAFTTVESYKIRELLVVEFHVSSHFYIPGEVPLISYMYEKLEQQFDEQSQALDKYMNDLSGMSDTNPFSKVKRIEVIDNRPASGGANLRSGNSDEKKKTMLILVPVVVTVTFFVLGLVFCLLFYRRKDDGKTGDDNDSYFGKGVETDNSSHEEGIIEEGTCTVEVPAMLNPNGTQYYGDDPETVRYLNSIRASGLEEAYKSSCSEEPLEEVSLDDVSIEDHFSEVSVVLDGVDNSDEHMVDTSPVTESYADESSNGKSGHAVEGNAPLLPHSEIAEEATSVVCENVELQDEEVHDVLLEEEKKHLTDEESASPGNGEADAEPASTSNAAGTTAALPPNDTSTEPVSKNDQDEFNYLHLDSSFEEDLRSIA